MRTPKKPITSYTLVPGFDYEDGRAPQWEDWFGKKTFQGDKYQFICANANTAFRIRVEAEGYAPVVSPLLRGDRNREQVELDFRLVKSKVNVAGTLIGIDGEPQAGVKVYLARQRMNIEDRKVGWVAGWDRQFVVTDDAGQFTFPPEVEQFCIVGVHETGLAMATEEELAKEGIVRLKPWTKANDQQTDHTQTGREPVLQFSTSRLRFVPGFCGERLYLTCIR